VSGVVAPLYRPSVVITIGAQVIRDINLPPPAPRGPRMAFRVRRTMTSEPDECEGSVWNLDPIREKTMSTLFHNTGTTPVTVAAGYGAFTSQIFQGDLRMLKPHLRNGPDYTLTFAADDAGDALSSLTLSHFTAGWTVTDMINFAILALATGDPLSGILPYPLAPHKSVEIAKNAVVPSARVRLFAGAHIGKVSDLLDEAARLLNVRWWVANHLLYMAARKLPPDELAVVLPRKTWLSEPQEDAEGVMRVDTLYDPKLVPGRVVTLVGRLLPLAPELFRCDAVELTGDTRGASPWRASLVLRRAGV
jgi:hypothetical protein